MSFEIFRMLTQQKKAFHCYIMLSVWILLLIAGIYKFLEPKPKMIEPIVNAELFQNLVFDVKTKKIFQICNLPHEITSGDEGIYSFTYQKNFLKLDLCTLKIRKRIRIATNYLFLKCTHSANFIYIICIALYWGYTERRVFFKVLQKKSNGF